MPKLNSITTPSSELYGDLHGGALSALADITAGVAIISFGKLVVTLNSNINYVRPLNREKSKLLPPLCIAADRSGAVK
jgi:uncharacterized protein (TIGR00369 family)